VADDAVRLLPASPETVLSDLDAAYQRAVDNGAKFPRQYSEDVASVAELLDAFGRATMTTPAAQPDQLAGLPPRRQRRAHRLLSRLHVAEGCRLIVGPCASPATFAALTDLVTRGVVRADGAFEAAGQAGRSTATPPSGPTRQSGKRPW